MRQTPTNFRELLHKDALMCKTYVNRTSEFEEINLRIAFSHILCVTSMNKKQLPEIVSILYSKQESKVSFVINVEVVPASLSSSLMVVASD